MEKKLCKTLYSIAKYCKNLPNIAQHCKILQNIAKYCRRVMWSSVTRVASSLTLIWCLALGAQVDFKEQTREDVKSQN